MEMGQALLNTAAPSALETASASYAVAFATFETAFDAASTDKGVAKVTMEAAKVAERAVMWAAFDLAMTQDGAGIEDNVAMIATRKGVKAENLPVYRLRARDMIEFAALLSKADRAKKSPFTLAKGFREERAATAARVAAETQHIDGAEDDAASDLECTVQEVRARVRNGDSLAVLAVSAALNERMGRASLVADALEFRARMAKADPDTLKAIGLVFAGFSPA